MDERQQALRTRLEVESKERGRMALISKETGISYQTMYGFLREKHKPNALTMDKLAKYFKRHDKEAQQ